MGSAIGTVVGLLIAPRTGKETRRILKKSANAIPELVEDLSTSIQMNADRVSESTSRGWDGTLIRLKEAVNAGIAAASQKQQVLVQTDSEVHDSAPQSVADSQP